MCILALFNWQNILTGWWGGGREGWLENTGGSQMLNASLCTVDCATSKRHSINFENLPPFPKHLSVEAKKKQPSPYTHSIHTVFLDANFLFIFLSKKKRAKLMGRK